MEQNLPSLEEISGAQNDDGTYEVRIPLNKLWAEYLVYESDGTFRTKFVIPRFQIISDEVIAELDQWDADNPPIPLEAS